VKFIDGRSSQGLVVAEGDPLCPPNEKRIEAGNAGSGDRAGIWTIEAIVVNELIRGDPTDTAVSIDSNRPLVVADRLRIVRGGVLATAFVSEGM
jgi:hypothetical protein